MQEETKPNEERDNVIPLNPQASNVPNPEKEEYVPPKPQMVKLTPVDLKDAMPYWISFSESGQFNCRYSITPVTNLVAMCMVKECIADSLKKEALRDKKDQYPAEVKKRMRGMVYQLEQFIADLANYVHDTESRRDGKPKIEILKP